MSKCFCWGQYHCDCEPINSESELPKQPGVVGAEPDLSSTNVKKQPAKVRLSNNKKYLRVQDFNHDHASTHVTISNITRVSYDLDNHGLIFTSDSNHALVTAQTYSDIMDVLENL